MLRIIIFISIYLAVYGGMHFYLYRRLRLGFELSKGQRTAVVAFLLMMVFGPLLSRWLEGLGWLGLTESVAILVFGWMGVLFLSASLFFFVDILRFLGWLLRHVARISLPGMVVGWRSLFVGIVSVSVVASLFGFYEAREIRVERVVLPTNKLPAGVERYRVVQLSDVHLGVLTDEAWLRRIVKEVNGLKPDLIVATGDIIDSNVASAMPFQATLSMLQASDGKYGVAGNHEFFAGIEKSVAYMGEVGFVMLRGKRVMIKPWLHLLGVDDREGRHSGAALVEHEPSLMAANEAQAITILLKHQPVVRHESIGKFDLQLAGHVHQGQIFPFRILTWLAYPIAMGLSDLGQGSQIYVTRGAGTWGPPIRLLAPPEITLFELVHGEHGE
jgi:predicted MPP superfamily phosphohydrolase